MERKAMDLNVGDYASFSPNTKAGTSGRQPEISGEVIKKTVSQKEGSSNLIVMVDEGEYLVKKSLGVGTLISWKRSE
jgi:hypothetical protein